jgi:hypothetical protein
VSWLALLSLWPSSMDLSWLNTRFQDTVMKSEPRLMSTAPSLPLLKLL